MNGKDLIVYILESNYVYSDIDFIINNLLVKDLEYAAKHKIGVASVHALVQMKRIPGVTIGNQLYIIDRGEDEKNN